MPAVIKIALGNLWEHKSKTLILGLLITIGVAIIIIGNAFLEASKTAMMRDLLENYTADVMIQGPEIANGKVSLFGVSAISVGEVPQARAIPDMDALKSLLAEYDAEKKVIKEQCSVISNTIVISSVEEVDPDYEIPAGATIPYGYVFAGSPEYYQMFDGIILTEGSYPSQTEPAILMEESVKESFESYYGMPVSVGDSVLVMGAYNRALREVKVCGFFKKENQNSAMVDICYLDPNTARSLADLTYGAVMEESFPDTVDLGMGALSEDDMFGGFDDFDMFDFAEDDQTGMEMDDDYFDNILGDTSIRDLMNTVDNGAWNFQLLRLKDSDDAPVVVAELNALFQEKGMQCIAKDWEGAAGSMASSTNMLSGVFTVMIVILAVVVFIVIMNTLVVSVIERTGEIGTMRALGGARSFVRKLFFTEAVTISGLASIAGVIIGLAVCFILNACHITVASDSAKLILGSAALNFIPTFSSVVSTALIIMAGSVCANFYPVSLALRITPLKAMNQGE